MSSDKTDMILVSKSKFNQEETIRQLNLLLAENGWKVITTHNFQEILHKNGTEIKPMQVLEVCKPILASEILTNDSLLMYSPLMPCRISVYMNNDMDCYISRLNSAAMASQIGGIIYQVMGKATQEIEGIISQLIQKTSIL